MRSLFFQPPPRTRPPFTGAAAALAVMLSLTPVTTLTACGGAQGGAASPVNASVAIDADPVALLPPGAVAVANLDLRALYASGSVGGQLAALAESMVPAGQELGFSPSPDVDRAVAAVYAGAALDGAVVLVGRFDASRFQAAAAAHAASRGGAPWVALPYAGRTLFTSGGAAVSPVTERTLLAGSEGAVRRALDRLAFGGGAAPHREVPDWMVGTLDTPGSAFAIAVDVGVLPPAVMHGFSLPGAFNGLSRTAFVGDFHPPGANVAGTLTYADPSRATAGADSLRTLAAIANAGSALGISPRIQNLSLVPEGANVSCRFALDDESMRRSLSSVVRYLTPAPAAATRPPG